jgi:hypothetical protein
MDNDPRQQRQTFLTVLLTVIVMFFGALGLTLITNGLFLWVLLIGSGIGGIALIHYVTWGKLLSDEVAGEREEEELRQRAAAEEWPVPERRTFRR